jgi:uncharacterized protein (TIGR02597 family)
MKAYLFLLGLLVMGGVEATARSGVTAAWMANQYIYVEPGNTTCIAPQYLNTGAGLLTQGGNTTNVVYGNGTSANQTVTEQMVDGEIATLTLANNYATGGDFRVTAVSAVSSNSTGDYQLQLSGKPPKNAGGVPLKPDQYAYAAGVQPVTYYVLVTMGRLQGYFFTVQGNTADSLIIDPEGLTLSSRDIRAISLRPYWSLSLLFPASQATISFIPTTDPSDVMTQVVISPPVTYGNEQPQDVGESFYFSADLNSWVSTADPSVSAADTVIPPGAYVYLQNTGTNNYPLHVFLSGSVLKDQFNFFFTSSSSARAISYFSLPRNTSYPINQIGFNNSNFTQSTGTGLSQRQDQLIIDDGHGGIAATYYRYKNQWYNTDNALPTNPTFAAGTVFGLMKPVAPTDGSSMMINNSNLPRAQR